MTHIKAMVSIFFIISDCQSHRKLNSKEIRCSNVQEVVKIPIYGFSIHNALKTRFVQ